MRNLILVFGLCLFATPVQPQVAPTLVGQRVWVRSPQASGRLDAGVKGTLEGVTGDSLQVRLEGGGPAVSVGLDAQTQLFLFTGRRSSAGRGAAIGAGIGALGGVVLGITGCRDELICDDPGAVVAAGAIFLGGIGAGIGLIVGALSHHDTWVRVGSSQTVRPVITPNGYGIGLGLRLSF
jgi:hypothetical protein